MKILSPTGLVRSPSCQQRDLSLRERILEAMIAYVNTELAWQFAADRRRSATMQPYRFSIPIGDCQDQWVREALVKKCKAEQWPYSAIEGDMLIVSRIPLDAPLPRSATANAVGHRL